MKLVIPLGEGASQEFQIRRGVIIIGRSPDNDIFLHDSRVAPDHALIRNNKEEFWLYEIDGRQNTWVNEKPVRDAQILKPGDRMRVGNTVLFFLEDETTLSPEQIASAIEEVASRSLGEDLEKSWLSRREAEEIKKTRPASSLLSFLKHGRKRLQSRTIEEQKSLQEIFEVIKARGAYEAFITTPAALLTMVQKLRGRDAEEAFPRGTWQFYTEFGLREDGARHANETLGYHKQVPKEAREIDMASSWVYQCILTYFEYDTLLENEWMERILLRLVDEAIEEKVIDRKLQERKERGERIPSGPPEKVRRWYREIYTDEVEGEREEEKRKHGLVRLKEDWIKMRPYCRDRSVAGETYPQYRRRMFLSYFSDKISSLSSPMEEGIWEKYRLLLSEKKLDDYQDQMSILYSLWPGRYMEEKKQIPLWEAKVAFILKGRYYLIDVCARDDKGHFLLFDPKNSNDSGIPFIIRRDKKGQLLDGAGNRVTINRRGEVSIEGGRRSSGILRPVPPKELKWRMAEIFRLSQEAVSEPSEVDMALAEAPRAEQENLRSLLPSRTRRELEELRKAPFIINWDLQDSSQTLGDIRNHRRGIGDHAMTIFRTEKSFVFNQSHIFFDAIWGISLSQVMTDGAAELYELFARIPDPEPSTFRKPFSVYQLLLQGSLRFEKAAVPFRGRDEVTVENDEVDLAKINQLRRSLKRAGIDITVNDILTLYRSIYDPLYVRSEVVTMGLEMQLALLRLRKEAAEDSAKREALHLIDETLEDMRSANPSLLIPMDASFVDPKQRLYPTTFRNPFVEIYTLYRQSQDVYEELQTEYTEENARAFLEKRKELFSHILGFTEYFGALKRMTMQGESFSMATIKMLAHLPPSMQSTLDWIPQKISILNEIIKGEEVFSNVGQVASSSSLSRFMSAKDDGETKRLVWGIMTDKDGRVVITLRDLRKHVAALKKIGHEKLARLIAQDYLDGFARGLNNFVEEMIEIARWVPKGGPLGNGQGRATHLSRRG
mgnify:CR=1 FL=1